MKGLGNFSCRAYGSVTAPARAHRATADELRPRVCPSRSPIIPPQLVGARRSRPRLLCSCSRSSRTPQCRPLPRDVGAVHGKHAVLQHAVHARLLELIDQIGERPRAGRRADVAVAFDVNRAARPGAVRDAREASGTSAPHRPSWHAPCSRPASSTACSAAPASRQLSAYSPFSVHAACTRIQACLARARTVAFILAISDLNSAFAQRHKVRVDSVWPIAPAARRRLEQRLHRLVRPARQRLAARQVVVHPAVAPQSSSASRSPPPPARIASGRTSSSRPGMPRAPAQRGRTVRPGEACHGCIEFDVEARDTSASFFITHSCRYVKLLVDATGVIVWPNERPAIWASRRPRRECQSNR